MKTGTRKLLKFLMLKRRLQLPEWQVVGILETMWQVALSNTPAGDIGKLPNVGIATLMEWEGDPDELIEMLVDCGWLDLDDEFRLIVHDWSQHVPNWLTANFHKHKKKFADEVARERSLGSLPEQPTKQPTRADHPGTVLLSNPNLTNPSPSPILTGPAAERQRQVMVVVKELVSLGMADAQGAVDSALGRNVDLDAIKAIRNHWVREGGRGIEALHWRIRTATPGVPADHGWPPRVDDSASIAHRRVKQAEAEDARAFKIIRDGRRAKKGDDVIRPELEAAGLDPNKYLPLPQEA